VVGLASRESRVGLFSFARYDPSFRDKFVADETEEDGKRSKKKPRAKRKQKEPEVEDEEVPREDHAAANRRILIARSCKVMVHEVFHMFNIEHCVYYSCCMNGTADRVVPPHVQLDNQLTHHNHNHRVGPCG
jgi:archaemetzincin